MSTGSGAAGPDQDDGLSSETHDFITAAIEPATARPPRARAPFRVAGQDPRRRPPAPTAGQSQAPKSPTLTPQAQTYFAASCSSAPLAIIRQYIEQQRRPD